jgi:hypothetical protein
VGAGGTGLEFAAEEPTPMQPDVPMDAARRAERNTRTAPRFECEEINVVFLWSNLFSRRSTIRIAARAAWMDKDQGARMLVSEAKSNNLVGGQFWGMEGTVPVLCC